MLRIGVPELPGTDERAIWVCNGDVHYHFNKALKAAGLPKIRFHDLRHTFCSLLIDQGESIPYIQRAMGHSTPMMTLNVYGHRIKPENQAAVCKLEQTVFQQHGSKMIANAGD
jgi:integrase